MILLSFNLVSDPLQYAPKKYFEAADSNKILKENTQKILKLLGRQEVLATFFVDITQLSALWDLLKDIRNQGHEIGLYHINSTFLEVETAKKNAQEILGKNIRGIRMRESAFSETELKDLQFNYAAIIGIQDIIFPFKKLIRKAPFTEGNGLTKIYESISPYAQIPYNEFTFQAVPLFYFQNMVRETMKNDDFVLINLNYWQFSESKILPFHLPFFKKYNLGKKMESKLNRFLLWVNENNIATSRVKDFIS